MSKYQAIEDINSIEHKNSLKKSSAVSFRCWTLLHRRYQRTSKCISSKSALLIYVWIFLSFLIFHLTLWTIYIIFDLFEATVVENSNHTSSLTKPYDGGKNIVNSIIAYLVLFNFCLYPLAGFLADNKFGRYKTVVWSLALFTVILSISFLILAGLLLPLIFVKKVVNLQEIIPYCLIITVGIAYILLLLSFVGISANIIQFGMDQLHDSPQDHQSLYILWYMWVTTLATFIPDTTAVIVLARTGEAYIFLAFPLPIAFLIISLYIAHKKRAWFLIESARLNPYKLVYRVTKFAHQHKVPVQRSAFTYCEDEVPSGMDLGKVKYGGPFTTEQVENVKAFYGILKILLALGPVFFIEYAISVIQPYYYSHLPENDEISGLLSFILYYGMVSPLVTIVGIPLYVCLIRPPVYHFIPGMLKRIGLGIILMVAALICFLIMDTTVHAKQRDTPCMFSDTQSHSANASNIDDLYNYYFLVAQNCLSSLSTVLFEVSLLQFICAQSPYSMKGMLIGLYFAMKGISIGISSIITEQSIFSFIHQSFPSCGMYYYLMIIGVGVVGFLIFVFVAKRYKYRKRDEICHVYRYAEEYYSRENPMEKNS